MAWVNKCDDAKVTNILTEAGISFTSDEEKSSVFKWADDLMIEFSTIKDYDYALAAFALNYYKIIDTSKKVDEGKFLEISQKAFVSSASKNNSSASRGNYCSTKYDECESCQ
jgi:hypothetical protein